MKKYLASSEIIDWSHPDVVMKAGKLANGCEGVAEIAKNCFVFVRDEIRHSLDFRLNPVTCRASDVLMHRTAYWATAMSKTTFLLRSCAQMAFLPDFATSVSHSTTAIIACMA
ncbi:MAG: hypothetical protein ACYC3O_09815 [Burkholderiales bacterium]